MKIYELKSQFGWKNDHGLGERLIQQIMRSEKTATAGPKDLYTAAELKALFASIGQNATVIDKDRRPRCNIRILDIFETKFGNLDPRLVQGEGYGSDAEAFRASHRRAWGDLVKKGLLNLNDETVLVVELFELVKSD